MEGRAVTTNTMYPIIDHSAILNKLLNKLVRSSSHTRILLPTIDRHSTRQAPLILG
jgi:hypothetical protein